MCFTNGTLFWNLLILLLFLLHLKPTNALRDTCPIGCQCDEDTQKVTCEGQQVVTLPDRLPSGYEQLLIRNSSVRTIEKNSFRKMEKLTQIEFENNPNLGTIEKLAFKGLKKIRLIKFTACPGLTELQKNSFSGIQNQMGLKIIFERTPIHRIDGHTFRHAQNIRELTISGEELALSRHCFANINQLDFLTVSGVVLIEPEIFTNSTRFHVVHFKNSQFDIPPNTFSSLSHTSHLLIEHTKIPSIAPDAFSGLTTIQVIEIHACQLGTISARAFANVENLGELKILRNTIGDLDTSESIMSRALKTRMEENTLECNCGMKWMTSVEEMSDINFCSTTASFRSIRSFVKAKCSHISKEVSRKSNHLPSTSGASSTFSNVVLFSFILSRVFDDFRIFL